jgi:SAM-dependent methyltransferase
MPKAIIIPLKRFVLPIFMAGVFAAPSVLAPAAFRLDAQTVEGREKWINDRQPPAQVMDAIGLKPGMVVGEVGAGRGRYTIHLAARVGPAGHVYANDIDKDGLAVIRERCRKDGLGNVETILGRVDDPLFPKASLDLVFMVYSYHHLARPVDMLKAIAPSLKPGATVVVIDPDPVKTPGETESEYTPREKIEREAGAAGFEIAAAETFLPRDNLFILKAKGQGGLAPGEATVWYLYHCGYAVRTRTKLLVFDYVEKMRREKNPSLQPPTHPALSNGWINPDEIKDLDVVVFVSHSHADHFDEVIRTWAKTVRNIHYVFGWDAGAGPNVHSLPAPRAAAKFGGLEIETVNSHHSGVPEAAFLIKVDGLTIYHNGDYVGRMGDYETSPSNVPADMNYLKTKLKSLDILCLDAYVDECPIQILQNLKPQVLFPMHYGGREEKYREFARDLKKAGIDIPVICPANPGDRFEYRNGAIVR